MLIPRLRDEPRFAGSRAAPAYGAFRPGCCDDCPSGPPPGCTCPCDRSLKFKFLIWPIVEIPDYVCGGCTDYKSVDNEPYSSDSDGSMYGCIRWQSGCQWRSSIRTANGGLPPLTGAGPYNCGDAGPPTAHVDLLLSDGVDCVSQFIITFPAGTVVYELTTPFDCEGSNTFTLAVDETGILGQCQLPDTMTIEPTDFCGPCDTCADTPSALRFTLTGTAGGGNCGTWFDGDYCLCAQGCYWYGTNGPQTETSGTFAEVFYTGPYDGGPYLSVFDGVTDSVFRHDRWPFFTVGNYWLNVSGLGLYRIPAEDFDCDGDNTFELILDDDVSGRAACVAPATIVVAASSTPCEDDCENPTDGCVCVPSNPRATIENIGDDGCSSCSCFALELCFSSIGNCQWLCEFTLEDIFGCTTTATYAILSFDDGDYASIILYDASDVALAGFRKLKTDIDCSDDPISFTNYLNSDSDCDWSGATCSLAMSATCAACFPCFPGEVLPTDAWLLSFTYDSDLYQFCMTDALGACSVLSAVALDEGATDLYAVLDFGESPVRYARVLVYRTSDDTLIGVYNYLDALSGFECDNISNTLYLATGNAGQCGEDVDVVGYTENLSATATVVMTDEPDCFTVGCMGNFSQTTAGSNTFPTVNGKTYIIECWGAGGGGHGGTAGNRSGGGGGGAYSLKTWVSDGSTLSITVGAGGAADTGATGNAGGDSSVGSLCVAKGGGGTSSTGTTPGAGGLASGGTGDTKKSGGDGGLGEAADQGGGGGGSAGTAANGNNGAAGSTGGGVSPAAGGAAVTGGGAGGAGGLLGAASPGGAPGGGGGGGDQSTGSAGGAGAAGKVLITCVE